MRAGHANGLPAPSIHARVTGRGATRTLVYRVKPLPGQTVSFEEHGRSGSGFIGRAHRASGRIRFAPVYGARERRTIVAVVTRTNETRTSHFPRHRVRSSSSGVYCLPGIIYRFPRNGTQSVKPARAPRRCWWGARPPASGVPLPKSYS